MGDLLATKTALSKELCLADRATKLGSFGRQAHMETFHCQMVWLSMLRPMRRSRAHSSLSRRMQTKSILDGKRSWVTQVSLQSRQQLLIGRRRQSCREILRGNLGFDAC